MKQGINRRLVNKVALRVSQCLLVAVFWAMTYSIVKAFEQDNRAVAVLQYHHVSEVTPFLTSIKPDEFEAHLDYLVQEKFDVISLSAFLARVKSGDLPAKKTAVITFDDAYLSIYDTAWPLLKTRGFPFSVFVNTQSVEHKLRHSMSWDQMREMAADGVEFANHTVTHLHMIRKQADETDAQWLARLQDEIEFAEAKIKQELGQSHKALAYPFGEYNPAIQSLLDRLGYVGFAQHSGAVGVQSHLQALPRFPFGGYYTSVDDFATKVNALAMPVTEVSLGFATGGSDKPETQGDISSKSSLNKFDDSAFSQKDWLYSHQNATAAAHFEVALTESQSKQLACYASGQGKVPVALMGKQAPYSGFVVEMVKPAPVGRSRFNCTLPSQWRGRFYWFSQPVIRLAQNDLWYPE
jgi:peptidoglycan/xylan/chitin deacetylase (PgdA/CDA1 family)